MPNRGVLEFGESKPYFEVRRERVELFIYCIFGRGKINAWRAREARAWVFVNFRIFSPCMARARRARAGLTVYPPSRTLEPVAFDEYCRFDTSAFLWGIKRGSIYSPKESRSVKTAIFIES